MSLLKSNTTQKNEILYILAVIFGKVYRLDHAIHYFKQAIIEDEHINSKNRYIDILIKIAICYKEKGEYEEALKYVERALAMDKMNCQILQHVAWCEFLLMRYDKALEHINQAIILKESNSDNYYIKGRILIARKEYTEATEAFKKALSLNDSKVIYLISSAILSALKKNYIEAFGGFLKAFDTNLLIPELWFNIAILYEIHTQYHEALVAYKKTIEIQPNFDQANFRIQELSSNQFTKLPYPEFVHPIFRVLDSMTPMECYIYDQKIKKAMDSLTHLQIFMHPNVNPSPAVPEDLKRSDKLPRNPKEENETPIKKNIPLSSALVQESVVSRSIPKQKNIDLYTRPMGDLVNLPRAVNPSINLETRDPQPIFNTPIQQFWNPISSNIPDNNYYLQQLVHLYTLINAHGLLPHLQMMLCTPPESNPVLNPPTIKLNEIHPQFTVAQPRIQHNNIRPNEHMSVYDSSSQVNREGSNITALNNVVNSEPTDNFRGASRQVITQHMTKANTSNARELSQATLKTSTTKKATGGLNLLLKLIEDNEDLEARKDNSLNESVEKAKGNSNTTGTTSNKAEGTINMKRKRPEIDIDKGLDKEDKKHNKRVKK